MTDTQKLQSIALNWDQSKAQKDDFHRTGKRVLNKIAKELGFEGNFEVRSNKGGPAVLGDVILHSDNIYINLGGSCFSQSFMYRTVSGMKDYTGGPNQWMSYEMLASEPIRAIQIFKKLIS